MTDYGIAVFSFNIANIVIDPNDYQRMVAVKKGETVSASQTETASEKTTFCSECGNKLGKSAKFCDNCGAKVGKANVCKNCGTENSSTAKFCENCGNKL